jgi:hypothetical protein
LAETLKYLYLLQSPDHPVSLQKYVITTEAHLLPMQLGSTKSGSAVDGPSARSVRQEAVPAPVPVEAPAAPAAIARAPVAEAAGQGWKGLTLDTPWPEQPNTGGCDGWYGNGYIDKFSLLAEGTGGSLQCRWHPRHRTQFCVAGRWLSV